MIVLILGAPGAGKGTQGDLLVERMGFRKLSTGDALRSQVKLGTELGKLAKSYLDEGKLLPDSILVELLTVALGRNKSEKILLDGYPRNLNQVEDLHNKLSDVHQVSKVVYLEVSTDELVKRLSGRRVCRDCGASFHIETMKTSRSDGRCDKCGGELHQRTDDLPDRIKTRLEIYNNETSPLINHYRTKGLLETVNGLGSTENIFTEIKKIL